MLFCNCQGCLGLSIGISSSICINLKKYIDLTSDFALSQDFLPTVLYEMYIVVSHNSELFCLCACLPSAAVCQLSLVLKMSSFYRTYDVIKDIIYAVSPWPILTTSSENLRDIKDNGMRR